MTGLKRRAFLAGTAALVAAPALAQSNPWNDAIRKARAFDQCRGLVVQFGGREVVAEIFRGPALGRAVQIKSVSKTLVAALTGAALDRGEIPSMDATLGDLAPNLIPRNADPRVETITVEHLITMQAGLERTSGANYGAWIASPNWVADALSRPMRRPPGTGMQYSTGSYHVLGALLSEVSGENLLSLARNRLGEPLGIDVPPWTRDPQGRYLGGNEMALSMRDMVRFGELYRHNGLWNGRQVLGRDWVRRSLQPVTRSRFSGLAYGYGWFLGSVEGEAYALARGYGGQIVCIVPGLELTVAITSDPTRPARSGGYFGDLMGLIEGSIIPTARKEA